MSQDTHTHGGARQGAGRKPKRKSEIQRTHSLRATDKDWGYIKVAIRLIKAFGGSQKKPRVMMMTDDEFYAFNRISIEEMIEQHHERMWGKEEQSEQQQQDVASPPAPSIAITKPQNVSEEEAVSLFLEYYRLNPIDAVVMNRSRLEREQHLLDLKKSKEEQRKVMTALEERAEDTLKAVDDINERVAQMLRFPGFKK